jgi:hypothetical protein
MQEATLTAEVAALTAARDHFEARCAELGGALAAERQAHDGTRAGLDTAASQVQRMAPLCIQPSPLDHLPSCAV